MFIASNRPEIILPLAVMLEKQFDLWPKELQIEEVDEDTCHLILEPFQEGTGFKIRRIMGYCDGWIRAWWYVKDIYESKEKKAKNEATPLDKPGNST